MTAALFAASAHAAPTSVPGLDVTADTLPLAAVQQQKTLVETTKDGTKLRVGCVVVDGGGSTDVSDKAMLYLTMYASSEMRGAWSLHPLGTVNLLVSAERNEPGVYAFVVRRHAPDGGAEVNERWIVDARQASIDVRAMHGADTFDIAAVTTPVSVTKPETSR
jgi:hypothetical protein